MENFSAGPNGNQGPSGVAITNVNTTTVANADGTTTITTVVNQAKFVEGNDSGYFVGATTETTTQTIDSYGNSTTTTTGQQKMSFQDAVKAIGPQGIIQGFEATTPGLLDQFAHAMITDIQKHPIAYATHAAGLALPFLGVPQAIEGIATAFEALITAKDLMKENQ